jgi:hypothetical protein
MALHLVPRLAGTDGARAGRRGIQLARVSVLKQPGCGERRSDEDGRTVGGRDPGLVTDGRSG